MANSSYLFGSATRSITPPMGVPLAGYWYLRRAEGVLDDLFARCLIIAYEDTRIAIVSLDLINIPTPFCDHLIERIAVETGLPREAVFISATHTHTAPALSPLMNPGEESPEYLETLLQTIPEMVRAAHSNLIPGAVGLGAACVGGLAYNRRILDTNGRVVTYKPDTYAAAGTPAGPVDSTLRLACFLDSESKPLAVLANFGLHPDTTGGSLISADFPGVFCDQLSRRLGPSAQVIFLNAPCGDVNHLDPNNPGTPYSSDNALRIGTQLAEKAAQMLHNLSWVKPQPLRCARKKLTLKVRSPELDAYRAAQEMVQKHSGPVDKPLSRARGLLRMSDLSGEPVRLEVSALTIGDWAIVGIPAEVFTQIGLDVRSRSPFKHTWVSGLTNGYCGYLPVQEAFTQGGYETQLGPGSFLEPNAATHITDACTRILVDLRNTNDQIYC